MRVTLVAILPLVAAVASQNNDNNGGDNDYCDISRQHTMCRYQGVGPACGHPLGRGASPAEQAEILDYHNRLRSRVATGSTGQPPAANMRQLAWDPELAAVAQRLADQCKFSHDCSDCRRVRRFGVGQNLYQSFTTRQGGKNSWRVAIDSWFDEIDQFPASSVGFYQFASATGHYSQMVWGETTAVGCGVTSYRSGRFTARLYVCNYGKAGNVLRRQVYKTGPACSACPAASACSDSYPGLCLAPGDVSPAPPPPRPQQPAPPSPAPTRPPRPSRPPPQRPCFGFFCLINRPFSSPVSMFGDVAMMGVNSAATGINTASDGVTNFVNSGFNSVTRPVNSGFNAVSRPLASGVNFVSRPALQAVNLVSRPFRFPSQIFNRGK